ncbi:MAG: MFS transporter [Gammaproteobacteria bacterium]|nr:MFS transporter [Gammaproteobacteria bacterium]
MKAVKHSADSLLYAWYVVAVLMLAYTFSFVDRQILSLMVGPIRRDLGISDTGFSLLSGFSFAVFYTLMGIPLGRYADNHSRRNLVVVGILFWSLMTTLCGFARQFWQLFITRMGVGVGEAALSPAAYSLISDYFPKEKLGKAISVYGTGIYLGAGMAFVVGGLVIEWLSNTPPLHIPLLGTLRAWQLAFIVVGLPGVLFALLALTIREPSRQGASSGQNSIPLREVIQFVFSRWQTFVPYILGISFISLFGYGVFAWFPEFIHRTYQWKIGDAGIVTGVIVLVFGSAGIISGGIFADTLMHRGYKDAHLRAVFIGACCLVPFAILFPLMPDANWAFTLFAGVMFFTSFHYGIIPSGLQIVVPNRMRGQISALYLFVNNIIGLGFGPTLVGLLTDYLYQDDASLYLSLASTAFFTIPIAAALYYFGLKPYRACVEEQVG